MRIVIYIFILLISYVNLSFAQSNNSIFPEDEMNNLLIQANSFIKVQRSAILKDIRGIVITFPLDDVINEYSNLSEKTISFLEGVEKFLAKNKNPVIIEVHTVKFPQENYLKLKNWEMSTVIANKIEKFLLKEGRISNFQVKSIGYGEFLPSKNTSNKGVKNSGRIDIIVLYNMSGE